MPVPIDPKRSPPMHGARRGIPWRCGQCNKLLGVSRDGRMHIRVARGHEYVVGFPVTATCRGCATMNEASGPAR